MKTFKKRSQIQEKSVAKKFNARPTVASGALWGMKSDVRNDKYLIECKTTEKNYYPITYIVWEKIEDEALKDHDRIPLLVVDLEDKYRYVIFNPKYFDKDLPTPYENSLNKDSKSFRLRLNELSEIEEDIEEYCYAKVFLICGKKRNLLCYMREEDFIKHFEEE